MKNLDIYINGLRAVYDNKTLVGSILRNFDFTDPANRKQTYTNSISLPVKQNQHIFEFASEPGYKGTVPYTRVSVEIIVDGYLLVKDGIGYLSSIRDGYYIVAVREQPDIIQTMKDRRLSTLGVASGPIGSPIAQTLLNATSGGKIDFIYNEVSRVYTVANPANFKLFRTSGNMTYYIHSIFSRMTTVDSITFAGGLMSDSFFLNTRVIASQIGVHAPIGDGFQQLDDVIFNSEKSFFDLFKAVLQTFGAVYTISGSTITIEKFDDLTLNRIDWSGKIQKVRSKKFRIPNLAQNNHMRFKTGGEADEKLNETSWPCNNKNIEFDGKIIEPDITVFPFLNLNGLLTGAVSGDNSVFIPDSEFDILTGPGGTTQTIVNSISDFVFLVDGPNSVATGTVVEIEYTIQNSGSVGVKSHTTVGGDNRTIATYYNSQNDYQRFAAMLLDPVMYEIDIDLNVLDLHDYDPFNIPTIPELAAEFYVNKLQYNFEKQGKASKIDIIKFVEP